MESLDGQLRSVLGNDGLVKLISSKNEAYAYYNEFSSQRLLFEKYLSKATSATSKTSCIHGYCDVCENGSSFALDWLYSDKISINFRERLVCSKCGLNNRLRFMIMLIKHMHHHAPIQNIYMYEQVTEFYKQSKRILNNINIVGSEYLGASIECGKSVNGIRNEDGERLTFADQSFDVLISCDVFEHVADINKVLSESYRVLNNSGRLIFSIPFHVNNENSITRARCVNGQVTHVLPPIYHGNPLSKEGSLVFYDFGWDMLKMCQQVGYKSVYMLAYYSVFHGYIGDGMQYLFIAEKK